MRSVLLLTVAALANLAACAFPSKQHGEHPAQFVGRWSEEAPIWTDTRTLDLRADGTYTLTKPDGDGGTFDLEDGTWRLDHDLQIALSPSLEQSSEAGATACTSAKARCCSGVG